VSNDGIPNSESSKSLEAESVPQPRTDRITRWILTAIGVYTGLLVTLLNIFRYQSVSRSPSPVRCAYWLRVQSSSSSAWGRSPPSS